MYMKNGLGKNACNLRFLRVFGGEKWNNAGISATGRWAHVY